MALGVGPGDRVAIASGNRSEWCLVDQAVLRIGAIGVPIYPTSSAEDYAYVLEHSGSKVLFAANEEIHAKGDQAQASCPALEHLFTFDRVEAPGIGAMCRKWDAKGPAHPEGLPGPGGTRGPGHHHLHQRHHRQAQGVMLTHDNILQQRGGQHDTLPGRRQCPLHQLPPLSHIYERMLMYLYLYAGVSIHFQESLDDAWATASASGARRLHGRAPPARKDYDRIVGRARSSPASSGSSSSGRWTWATGTKRMAEVRGTTCS